jgi:MerR family transcriptional regulator, thiopeptide resistance regulator
LAQIFESDAASVCILLAVEPSGQKRYRIHEFARLAGVTVRALHQFDRLGLLKPGGRSGSGYRQYAAKDLVTLRKIVMLKSMGLTPEEIKRVITRNDLSGVRTILEQKQLQLSQMIQAIREAQISGSANFTREA